MRKHEHSRIQINLTQNNETMTVPADEAAEYINISLPALLTRTNRYSSFTTDDGITVSRVVPPGTRTGTTIKSAATGHIWPSIKAFCKTFGLNAAEVEQEIRIKQMLEHDGHTYFAPDYKEIHRTRTSNKTNYGNMSDVEAEPTTHLESTEESALTQQQIIETIDYEVNKTIQQLTTEERCEALLQELIIERARNKDYKGTAQALKAVQVLTAKDYTTEVRMS